MQNNWPNVKAWIEKKVGKEVYQTFFARSELLSVDEIEGKKVAIIQGQNIFLVKNMNTKYKGKILEAFRDSGEAIDDINCVPVDDSGPKVCRKAREVTGGAARDAAGPRTISRIAKNTVNKINGTNLNPKYTMDNFVVGSNNDLAASVARAVIDSPGETYNPLYIYGASGLGKTHLLNAIGNALLKKDPEMKILYLRTNQFYEEFLSCLDQKKGREFSQKFLKLDMLIIDDIQMIAGKNKTQEEFFNIFNEFHQKNKQIIIASDRLPSQIERMDVRLSSRMSNGGAFDIQMPSFEDKCAILRSKADYEGKEIEGEAIEYIAENVKTNIRDLESEFARVMAMSELKGISPLELIQGGYKGVTSNKPGIVSPKQIVNKTAKVFQIEPDELKSKSRMANIKTARQVAMYLLAKELGMSTTKIAGEVGVKDHTTVMHGINKIEGDLKLHFGLRDQIDEIRRSLYA